MQAQALLGLQLPPGWPHGMASGTGQSSHTVAWDPAQMIKGLPSGCSNLMIALLQVCPPLAIPY